MNTVKIVLESDLPRLEQLWRDIEREEHPGDGGAGDRAVLGSRRSLSESAAGGSSPVGRSRKYGSASPV
jgi:hypothetical protein